MYKRQPPFRTAQYSLFYYDVGNKIVELVHVACELGIIIQRGSWYNYEELKTQGKAEFQELVRQDKKLQSELLNKIKQLSVSHDR